MTPSSSPIFEQKAKSILRFSLFFTPHKICSQVIFFYFFTLHLIKLIFSHLGVQPHKIICSSQEIPWFPPHFWALIHILTSSWIALFYLIHLRSSYSSSKTQPKYSLSWETSLVIPNRIAASLKCWTQTAELWPTCLLYPASPALCGLRPRMQREERTQT